MVSEFGSMERKSRIIFLIFLVFALMNVSAQTSQFPDEWTLSECIKYAVENNISVKKAKLDKSIADLNYQQSKNNRLPEVSSSASQNFAYGSSIDPITSDFIQQSIHSSNFGISSQVSLYNGNKANHQIEQYKLISDQNNLLITEAENSIKLSIAEAYIQALYYNEGIKIAQNTAKSTEEQLNQAQTKYNQGAIALKDLKDIETQHSTNLFNIVSAQNYYTQQVLVLKQLLELDPSVDFKIATPDTDSFRNYFIPNKSDIYQKAIQNLPDYKLYDVKKAASEKDLDIAKSGYLPSISLSAGINTGYTSSQSPAFTKQLDGNLSEQIGLSISIPIFNKFSNKTNVQIAKINIQQVELDQLSVGKDLYKNIETAWQNATANQSEMDASKVAKDNSKLAYDLATKKYEFGALTPTELIVSQNTYISAMQKYLQVKYMGFLYQQLLEYYQGNEIKLN